MAIFWDFFKILLGFFYTFVFSLVVNPVSIYIFRLLWVIPLPGENCSATILVEILHYERSNLFHLNIFHSMLCDEKLTSNLVMSPLNRLTFSASPAFQRPAFARSSSDTLAVRVSFFSSKYSFHVGMSARDTKSLYSLRRASRSSPARRSENYKST